MYDSAPLCPSSSPPEPSPLFHPKPVRPAFTSSYSSPLLPTSTCTSPPFSSTTGSASASSSPSPPHIPNHKSSHSLSSKPRAKAKKMSSTTGKHKNVQVALEVKVERSRGFHAFFVPLARSMPPAPPSSPVFGQSSNEQQGAYERPKVCEERWVEDVQRMDLD
ncbi:hypothetical protein CcaverHIS002_0309190 [Cutaneotrichosporon cavernicola]|uniref:Uncharacterized protein n=1 Tax=Cutaneotrichosporon cavernicola TaxID=279322 RepID=A0AA48IAH2_9TREE|nr:uncharacterized protein CcaverHIS019_0309050 [Cutaneotrichosporon cavernicola]BEI83051.1 hypothetical protein CcaverHIS002_0309190 [Cutaneotrichosporon cavernicola]BEI90835.1 hypothetical protein CcaverHIS019_0309050 [Cutaneotrichosporon cavernicola]BEI98614.1 hypothetical protein CcaverHIS631_0309130 [Cutaneotrichosporon cavernicola]BEJ06383.1 hypothetical protein CcaverHIS641_0309050 [Cutaneotrichosporon cavernicola]